MASAEIHAAPAPAPAATVKLSATEKDWLVKMAVCTYGISRLVDAPPLRTMKSLVTKGLAEDIMGTFWKITDAGRVRCTTIY